MVLTSSTPAWPSSSVLTVMLTGAGSSRSACSTTCLRSSTPACAAWACSTWYVVAAAWALAVMPVTFTPASAPTNSTT